MMQPANTANWEALYKFQSHQIYVDGHRYHYLDEGRGEPLLFVHGNPTWSFHWRDLIRGLSPRYRTIAPDHIGCGLSDKPQDWSYRFTDHVANLVALVDKLDLKEVTLIAQDWGGAIGLAAALARPDRFLRFVLFNTGAFPPWYIPWRIRACRIPFLGRYAVQGKNLFSKAALRMALAKPEKLSDAERAGYLAPYQSWPDRIGVYRFVKDIPASKNHPTYAALAALEAGLPTLANRPMQLIWGMRDWCFRPECLEKLADIFPSAYVYTFPEAGHWVLEEARKEVLGLIDFFLAAHPVPSNREFF